MNKTAEALRAWLLKDYNAVRVLLFALAVIGLQTAIETIPPDKSVVGVDRMLYWSFVVFVVGLGELFVLLIMLAVFNKIDLAQAFMDKELMEAAPPPTKKPKQDAENAEAGGEEVDPAAPASQETSQYVRNMTGSVSLSRLQAFLWTLIVLILYFHEAVRNKLDGKEGMPEVSSNMLFLMGISSVVYLAGTASKSKKDGKDS